MAILKDSIFFFFYPPPQIQDKYLYEKKSVTLQFKKKYFAAIKLIPMAFYIEFLVFEK